ncbi:MAG: helix-turn-helix transcriptional regulator [Gammaproteobacteria bacterium]|nr:helix-turn-helix transcriptional regulator [Gammaproteobacteria bacterium]
MAKQTSHNYHIERLGDARIIDPDKIARPAFVLHQRYARADSAPHKHRKGQLLYAAEGVPRIETDGGSWIVPPQRGVWLPPGFMHRIVSRRSFTLCSLYIESSGARALPKRCCTVAVTPLVRELLLQAAHYGGRYPKNGPQARLHAVLIDQVATLPQTPLYLPEPKDRRLRTITAALRADPAATDTLEDWATRVGASSRTLARLFTKETKLSFAMWRQQLRLLVALEALAQGRSVTAAAVDVGYQDTSAFIAMFRQALGVTPGRYFESTLAKDF